MEIVLYTLQVTLLTISDKNARTNWITKQPNQISQHERRKAEKRNIAKIIRSNQPSVMIINQLPFAMSFLYWKD